MTMTADELDTFLAGLGLDVTAIVGARDQQLYTVVAGFTIPHGGLAGRMCDIAIARSNAVPYVVPPAIHTRPALVPMSPGEPLGTQASPIGNDWQYWSRRFDRPPSPKAVWTHILTVLCDPRWPSS